MPLNQAVLQRPVWKNSSVWIHFLKYKHGRKQKPASRKFLSVCLSLGLAGAREMGYRSLNSASLQSHTKIHLSSDTKPQALLTQSARDQLPQSLARQVSPFQRPFEPFNYHEHCLYHACLQSSGRFSVLPGRGTETQCEQKGTLLPSSSDLLYSIALPCFLTLRKLLVFEVSCAPEFFLYFRLLFPNENNLSSSQPASTVQAPLFFFFLIFIFSVPSHSTDTLYKNTGFVLPAAL